MAGTLWFSVLAVKGRGSGAACFVKHRLFPDAEVPEDDIQQVFDIDAPGNSPQSAACKPDILGGQAQASQRTWPGEATPHIPPAHHDGGRGSVPERPALQTGLHGNGQARNSSGKPSPVRAETGMAGFPPISWTRPEARSTLFSTTRVWSSTTASVCASSSGKAVASKTASFRSALAARSSARLIPRTRFHRRLHAARPYPQARPGSRQGLGELPPHPGRPRPPTLWRLHGGPAHSASSTCRRWAHRGWLCGCRRAAVHPSGCR